MNELLLELQPHLMSMAVAILTALGAYITNKVRVLIDERIEAEQQEKIKDIVRGVVTFVEQVAKVDLELEGQKKFELAKEKALLLLHEKGFMIGEEELKILIESFVNGLKTKEEE